MAGLRDHRSGSVDSPRIAEAIDSLERALADVRRDAAPLAGLWSVALTGDDLGLVARLAPAIARQMTPARTHIQQTQTPGWSTHIEGAAERVGSYLTRSVPTRSRYAGSVIPSTREFSGRSREASDQCSDRKVQNSVLAVLRQHLLPGHSLEKESLLTDLNMLISDQEEATALTDWARQIPALNLPPAWHVSTPGATETLRDAVDDLSVAGELTQRLPATLDVLDALSASGVRTDEAAAAALSWLCSAWEHFGEVTGVREPPGDPTSPFVARIESALAAWKTDTQHNALGLRRWAAYGGLIRSLQALGLAELWRRSARANCRCKTSNSHLTGGSLRPACRSGSR